MLVPFLSRVFEHISIVELPNDQDVVGKKHQLVMSVKTQDDTKEVESTYPRYHQDIIVIPQTITFCDLTPYPQD